jgi:hypothetical protein
LLREEAHQQDLPLSLYDNNLTTDLGAISLFENDNWFSESLNKLSGKPSGCDDIFRQPNLGDKLKQMILEAYQQKLILNH